MTSRISFVLLGVVGVVASSYLNSGSGYSVLTNHYGNYLEPGLVGKYYEPKQYEPISYPKYSFDYGVKDAHTGDQKSQWEKRDGDVVKGGYTLKEADGTTRIVEYAADGHSGFNAIVKNIGHAYHPQVYKKEGYGQSLGLYNLGGYSGGVGHGLASSYVNINQHH